MLGPDDCSNMAEIRAEIDQLDHQVVALLGQRFQYVQAASKFKTSQERVKAPDRVAAMLQQRRMWAEQAGLDADVIEKLYSDLVNYFIRAEMKKWDASHLEM